MLIGTPRSLVARFIGCAPLRYLGKISYALYLFHLLIRNVVYNYMPTSSLYLTAAITIAASLALAALSWRLIESPVLARGRRAAAGGPARGRRFASAWPRCQHWIPGKVPFGLVADNITAPCRPNST